MKFIYLFTFACALNLFALFGNSQNLLEAEKRTIAIYNNVKPSVVNITNVTTLKRRGFFFLDQSRRQMPEEEMKSGAGTGFVWDTSGHIITNYHVVSDENAKLMVSFENSKEKFEAKVVGVEPKLDIAVLKVKKLPRGIRPVTPGNSGALKVGQMAAAIGNPFELDYSMSMGIISALGRKVSGIGGVEIHNMIQTDATINPGNSGGPLLDSNGLLIGMNTMIFTKSGASNGIGFAVPVDDIKTVVPDLIKYGKVKRPALGIRLMDERNASAIRSMGYTKEKNGIIIADVVQGSGANQAGLKGVTQDRRGTIYMGDIILKVEGISVNNYNDIFHALRKFSIGDKVNVTIRRANGKKKTIKLKLQELK